MSFEVKGSGIVRQSGSGRVDLPYSIDDSALPGIDQLSITNIKTGSATAVFELSETGDLVWSVFSGTFTQADIASGTGAVDNGTEVAVTAGVLTSISITGLSENTNYTFAAYADTTEQGRVISRAFKTKEAISKVAIVGQAIIGESTIG